MCDSTFAAPFGAVWRTDLTNGHGFRSCLQQWLVDIRFHAIDVHQAVRTLRHPHVALLAVTRSIPAKLIWVSGSMNSSSPLASTWNVSLIHEGEEGVFAVWQIRVDFLRGASRHASGAVISFSAWATIREVMTTTCSCGDRLWCLGNLKVLDGLRGSRGSLQFGLHIDLLDRLCDEARLFAD